MATWEIEDTLEVELPGLAEAAVSMIGGDLSVRGGSGPAHLEVERRSGAPVRVRFDDGVLTVVHDEAGRWLRRHETRATVILTAPSAVSLRADTVSASVFVDGITEPVRVHTVSGEAVLSGLGRVDVESTSGAIEALEVTGPLRAHSVSGSVTVARGRCPEVEARSTSGEIVLDIEPSPGGRYRCETVSGAVAVRIPASASARVDATSVSGRLNSSFDLEADNRRPAHHRLSGAVGAGEAELSLRTVSGAVTVLERGSAA